MSDDPDAIRANIEATRRNLSGDVDALADKVTPSKIAQRQTRKVKPAQQAMQSVKETAQEGVSAVTEEATDRAADVADEAKQSGQRLQSDQ